MNCGPLLILDDVWEPEVAQYFAIHCPTLVTSRNSKVANKVFTHDNIKHFISIDDGKPPINLLIII